MACWYKQFKKMFLCPTTSERKKIQMNSITAGRGSDSDIQVEHISGGGGVNTEVQCIMSNGHTGSFPSGQNHGQTRLKRYLLATSLVDGNLLNFLQGATVNTIANSAV